MSRLQEPSHHPAQPTAAAESPALRRRGREPRTREFPRTIVVLTEAGHPRAQEPHPPQRAHPVANSGQPRLRSATSLGATREGASLGVSQDSASLGVSWCWARSAAETLVPRFCDSELVDPAECATREFEAGDLAPPRLGDVDRGGLRGRTRRCEAARSAVHSAAAPPRAPAELAPADAAESAALHNVFAFLLRRLGAEPRP